MVTELPPLYSQHDPDLHLPQDPEGNPEQEPHILILPAADSVNFQKGYLGSEGEHAAIEGELQIKCSSSRSWGFLTLALRSVERAYEREIELALTEVTLFKATEAGTEMPASIPFSIPLPTDTPQSLHTPTSSLSHTLIVKLQPFDISETPFTRALEVHTKRYTSHEYVLGITPETHSFDDPTHCKVQVPRTTFRAEENIPVYVTIPPPARDLVVERGVRLRNVIVELVRVITVKKDEDDVTPAISDSEESNTGTSPVDGPSSRPLLAREREPTKDTKSPLFLGSAYRSTIARSGASCRFHSRRSVQLRFVLHMKATSSPCVGHQSLPSLTPGNPDISFESDEECPSISQETLLHFVSFRLKVYVAFVDTSRHNEQVSTVSIPIKIIPPAAPLPEVGHSVDMDYAKKYDRPPARTVRYDDSEVNAPFYSQGEAGPSFVPNGAPPPFEERDEAPPPFFHATPRASAHLPTFLESEREVIIPPQEDHPHPPLDEGDWLSIAGEGEEFGFRASEQFDGHADDPILRSSTPPPTISMSDRDANLTELADFDIHSEPEHAMEILNRALEHQNATTVVEGDELEELPPPPPPAMDDPSDPPPSIDSDFRAPTRTSPPHPYPPDLPAMPPPAITRDTHHAPPPYLNPNVTNHPPPYVDLEP